jgi:hypothetical protein
MGHVQASASNSPNPPPPAAVKNYPRIPRSNCKNQEKETEAVLLGIEEILGEAGLDVARLLLARLLARLRHLLPTAAGRIRAKRETPALGFSWAAVAAF